MSWCFKNIGPKYHWLIDLYDRIHLPIIPAIIETLHKEVVARQKEVDRGKTEEKKKGRICMKVARAEDQEAKKKWLKRQEVHHSYGTNDANECKEDDEVDPSFVAAVGKAITGADENCGTLTFVSGKSCSCWSNEHCRISHSKCPLNPKSK